ncbi:tail fiber domain-containing protein [Myxococcus stipitatus]|uniref:tail fiber domain-containing protein n=1 Tax=Myxococcus stipitatus TaxID=83455 RepID=UPI001F439D9E|nr:tail fiber domain-containing protein [Myxococcus stipitatus]MCE9671263.1 tail fiber domain-containing protein [Myxococcus stipitatus]
MSVPYYPAKSGDPILADTWNNMQIKARDEIRAHTHRGGDDGKKLDGESIAATAVLKVTRVETTAGLLLNGVELTDRLASLDGKKLDLSGGAMTGPLTVGANVGIGAAPSTRRLLVVNDVTTNHNAATELRLTGSNAFGVALVLKTTAGNDGATLQLRSRAKSWLVRGETGSAATGFQIAENGGDTENGNGYGDVRLHLKAGGNLGLNTADPQGALDIRVPGTAAGFDRLVVGSTTLWGDTTPQVTIGANGGNGFMMNNPHVAWLASDARASVRYGRSGGTASGGFWDVGVRANNAFSFLLNNTTHHMWLAQDGSVGIGTTAPTARLDVQGGSLKVSGGATVGGALTCVSVSAGSATINGPVMCSRFISTDSITASAAIIPSLGDSAVNGIQFPQDAYGGSGDSAYIRYFKHTPSYVADAESTKLIIGNDNDNYDIIVLRQMNGDRLTLSNGYVGINVPSATQVPRAPMHIIQSVADVGIRLQEVSARGNFVSMAMESGGIFHIRYNTNVGAWLTPDGQGFFGSSDASLKTNLAPLDSILPRVMALTPKAFDWKSTGTRTLGFVAQEVEPLFPELVGESKQDADETKPGIKGLNYSLFGVLAIAALQEMKQQYDQRIAMLEQRLRRQESQS